MEERERENNSSDLEELVWQYLSCHRWTKSLMYIKIKVKFV